MKFKMKCPCVLVAEVEASGMREAIRKVKELILKEVKTIETSDCLISLKDVHISKIKMVVEELETSC